MESPDQCPCSLEYDPVFGLVLESLGQTDVRPVRHPLIGPVIASLLERGTMAIRLMNRLGAQGYWMGDGRIWRPNERAS